MLESTLFHFKLFAILAIFLIALLAGLLPWSFLRMTKRYFALGDAFADGIFLSIALFHMLPEAAQGFRANFVEYPMAYLLCLLVFVVLVSLERGFSIHFHVGGEEHTHVWKPYVLISVLSIHSILAGTALGVEPSSVGAAIIFLAIITHKGAASFALGNYMQRFGVNVRHYITSILVFSLMTPLGIILGSTLVSEVTMAWADNLTATFLALASGTFLYIGTAHILERPYFDSTVSYLSSFFSMLFGISLMAVVAIWL